MRAGNRKSNQKNGHDLILVISSPLQVTQASDENEMFLRAQFSFMRHLADRGFTVPAAVPTTFGHVMSRIVSTRGGEARDKYRKGVKLCLLTNGFCSPSP